MKEKLLQDIGLTEGESKVYFALVKLGATKTGALSKQAEVSSSKVYKILDRLENKGLVGHAIKGKIKYFTAMNPNRLVDYIDKKEEDLKEKKQEVKKIIPEIELAMEKSGNKSEATILQGFKAVTNFFRGILDELKSGETYYVLGATYGEVPGLRDFFYNHHTQRAEKKIKLKMLANHDTKENIELPTKKNAEIKYLPQYLMTSMEIVFYNNKAFIVLWTKSPTGFLIQNEEAVESFKKYFDAFWKIAKEN
jgi:HTH-type transcriptional regulator, sugar sensing transcriptional regulator